jgi:tRNA threonylcarbamoyladenosine biosynthesis protein TsaB
MKILALEFSSERRSAAIRDTSAKTAFEAAETASGPTKAFSLIESALQQAKADRNSIDCIAIGLGPGSYTGIRIAISIAQGWQLVHPIKLQGLSSVETIALQAQEARLFGTVTILIDAQRGEFYLATYNIAQNSIEEITPLRLAIAEEARARASAGDIMVGPEILRWFPAGHQLFPSAAQMARSASRRSEFITGDKLEPIYLRQTTFVKAPPPRTII